MAIFIEVLEGASEGERFQVTAGMKIGRSEGEIRIRDAKVSSLHARVESNEKGELFLIDMKSTNGLRLNGKRVNRVQLKDGLSFQIGKTLVRVQEYNNEPETGDKGLDWKASLTKQLDELELKDPSPSNINIRLFSHALKLKFLQGIQAEKIWELSYGPRRFGANSLDYEIFEPGIPDMAFRLSPGLKGEVIFETEHPDLVKLNDQSISSEQLRDGDQIRLGNSLIQVQFAE